MTSITVTEYSEEPIVSGLGYGTVSKRMRVYLRFTSTTSSETLDLTTLNPNIADVEGVLYETDDGAQITTVASATSWSTYTITNKCDGVQELGLVVTLN